MSATSLPRALLLLFFCVKTAFAADSHTYETHVTADRLDAGQHVTVTGEALRTAPGTLGDPFRVVGLLPGVTSPLPILPLYAVRGASPGMTGYFLDGMRLPQLFHMFAGGGVVHAGLVDRLDFFPGAYDVTLGRFAGGVISAETRPARRDKNHFEAELRLYDVSALVELKLPRDVSISMSGHYGYPSLLLKLIRPGVDVTYWDYQLRLDWHGLTVQALGSYDALSIEQSELTSSSQMTFHRLQARLVRRQGPLLAEAAIIGGLDQMQDFFNQRLQKLFLGYRATAQLEWSRLHLHIGIDGELSRFRPSLSVPLKPGEDPEVAYGDLIAERNGMTMGVALQGKIMILPERVTLTVGTRVDLYESGPYTLFGYDPRARLQVKVARWLELTMGGGVYQQPPSFPVQMPGIDTFALQLGLQRALHLAIGQKLTLPKEISLTATGYINRYDNVSDFPPILVTQCAQPKLPSLSGAAAEVMRVADGQSFGMELLLRKQAGRFSGWIAYTLSRSERFYPCGIRPTDFDQTHVLNVVAQLHLPRAFMLSGRLYFASGRPDTVPDVRKPDWREVALRNNFRLPNYVQLDLRIDRAWQFRRWQLSLFLELLNVTYSQTVLAVSQPPSEPPANWRPELIGFRWILPSIGARGQF